MVYVQSQNEFIVAIQLYGDLLHDWIIPNRENITARNKSGSRKNRQSDQSQLIRLRMPLCPILAIFCSAWKQPLILISFTVACLGSHRHEQEPTLNFYSNHEAQNSC